MQANKLDAEYWRKRWQNGETGWDAGAPTTPLLAFFETLVDKDQSILIPGAGNAWEAEYLHANGFTHVNVLDLAPEALASFSQRNPDFPPHHLHQQDFFEHEGSYDLIIEQTFFCALQPAMRHAYAEKMHKLLRPGARLVGLLFTVLSNTEGPPFGGTLDEYTSCFSPWFRSVTMLPCLNSIKPREGRELFVELVR